MKSMMLSLAGVSILTSILTFDRCHADDIDWAAGQWNGYIQNWKADKSSRDVGARVLAISIDKPGATPNVTWSAPAGNPASVDAKVTANALSFEHDGATIELHLDANSKLSGTYVGPRGNRFGLMLTRAKPVTNHDGTWTGTATSDVPKCFPGRANLSISGGEVSGTVHYIPPHPTEGPGKIAHISDVSGVVWPDDVVFIRLKKHENHGRNSWFHAQIEGNQIHANDPGYTEEDCAFRMTLNRTAP